MRYADEKNIIFNSKKNKENVNKKHTPFEKREILESLLKSNRELILSENATFSLNLMIQFLIYVSDNTFALKTSSS